MAPRVEGLQKDSRRVDIHQDNHAMTDSSFALESLLLFQSVAAHGATQQSFARISEALKSSDLLRQTTSVKDHDDRFDAKALTDTYLKLLKVEAAKFTTKQSSNSTGRPASPNLVTVEDAAPHHHLVTGIIPKLYDEYKARAVHEVKEEEVKYDRLVKELEQLRDQSRTVQEPTASSEAPAQRPASSGKAKIESILNHEEERPAQTTQSHANADASIAPATAQKLDSPNPSFPRQSGGLSPSKLASNSYNAPQSSMSPRILAPPPSSNRPGPPSPGQAWQYQHPHSQPTYDHQRGNRGLDAASTLGQAGPQQYPSWLQYPYHPQGSASSPHTRGGLLPYNQSQPGTTGGGQLPPFSLNGHVDPPRSATPVGSQQVPAGPQLQSREAAQTLTTGTPQPKSGDGLKLNTIQQSPAVTNLLNAQSTTHFSPGSRTGWEGPLVAEKGRPRSISPVTDRELSPRPDEAVRTSRRSKPGALRLSRDAPRATGRRGSKTPSLPATSASQGRTRSQSIVSNNDNHSVASGLGLVKGSHSRTSTPTPNDRPSARHRRNQSSTTTATAKRKRRDSTADSFVTAEGALSPLPPRPQQQRPEMVIATRNFTRMTNPLMENIASHKLASRFAAAVPKKTPGYYEAIREPTDLKSIRSQIAQGSRTVTAATMSMKAGSPGGEVSDTGTTVALPYSEELEPPKAIVNADQLEQELMRMFANAAMFNEGDGGLVAEAREMCEDVGKILADFRGAEGGAMVMDDDGGTISKRRRA